MKNIFSFAQKGLVFNNTRKKILVNRYLESKYLPDKLIGRLCLPGGQVDFGEDPDKSFVREVKEETGITIKPLLPFYVWTWIYKKDDSRKQIVAVARLAFYKNGKIIKPKGETETKMEKARWIDINKIEIDKFVEDEQPIIKKFLKYSKSNPFTLHS
jgi:8-oxo-dGTP pyrophosphatase MutT (NUDIX family)